MSTFSTRLSEAIQRSGTGLCVGLDPRWELLPRKLRESVAIFPPDQKAVMAVWEFCRRVLRLVRPIVGVIKAQAAFFELLGPRGMEVLAAVLKEAKQLGFITILDAKRGDIASTATAYAQAAFSGNTIDRATYPVWDVDALTVHPYLGADAIEPFVETAKTHDRGVFILVRTSNPGAGLFQDLDCGGKPLYEHVAAAVSRWNAETVDDTGLGAVGAVVGATQPRELRKLRELLPQVWFLVPGYGTQGGTAADVRAAFRPDGLGAIVNSSRGVTFSFHPDDPEWESKIVVAAKLAAEELRI